MAAGFCLTFRPAGSSFSSQPMGLDSEAIQGLVQSQHCWLVTAPGRIWRSIPKAVKGGLDVRPAGFQVILKLLAG